jgi:hypothetical protein
VSKTEAGRKRRTVVGMKIEIDAVKKDQGSEKLWNYWLILLEKEFKHMDYTRVISAESISTPSARAIEIDTTDIIHGIQNYLEERIEDIIEEPRDEMIDGVENYEGFLLVDEKRHEIHKQ